MWFLFEALTECGHSESTGPTKKSGQLLANHKYRVCIGRSEFSFELRSAQRVFRPGPRLEIVRLEARCGASRMAPDESRESRAYRIRFHECELAQSQLRLLLDENVGLALESWRCKSRGRSFLRSPASFICANCSGAPQLVQRISRTRTS